MKSRFFIILMIVIFAKSSIFSQNEKGDKYFNNFEYSRAINHYLKAFKKTKDPLLFRKLGICYLKTQQYENALTNYHKLDSCKLLEANDYFNMALILSANNKAYEAKKYLDLYYSKSNLIEPKNYIFNGYVSILPLKNTNTEFSEFCPQLIFNKLYFTSDRSHSTLDNKVYGWTNTSYLTVFYSNADSSIHSRKQSVKIKELKDFHHTDYHFGPLFFTSTGDSVFFNQVIPDKKKAIGRSTIYLCIKVKGKWQKPILLPFNGKEFSCGHPAWDAKKKILYFASDKNGGLGRNDIYSVKFNGSTWEEVRNLGPNVNSPADEVFPCINFFNCNELYFSSNGLPGYGGLDLFKIDLSTSSDGIPFHLGPINSSRDDFGITFLSESEGVFSSDRIGGLGKDDLYKFKVIPGSISICLIDKATGLPISNGKILQQSGSLTDTLFTDDGGCFLIKKLPDNGSTLTFLNLEELSFETYFNPPPGLENLPVSTLELKNGSNKLLKTESVRPFTTIYVYKKEKEIKLCFYKDNLNEPISEKTVIITNKGDVGDTVRTNIKGCIKLNKLDGLEHTINLIDANEIGLDIQNEKDEFGPDHQLLFTNVDSKNLAVIASKSNSLINVYLKSLIKMVTCITYQKNGMPYAMKKILVKDINNNIIDTLITDTEGCVEIKKLNDAPLSIMLLEDSESGLLISTKGKELFRLSVLDKDGNVMKEIFPDDNGLNKILSKKMFSACFYDKKTGLPIGMFNVNVLDEKRVVIDTIWIPESGCITFNKLPTGDQLILQADASDIDLKLTSPVNAEVKNLTLKLIGPDNSELSSMRVPDGGDVKIYMSRLFKILGCIRDKKTGQILKNYTINVLDSSKNIVQSSKTDEWGCFKFENLKDINSISFLKLLDYSGLAELSLDSRCTPGVRFNFLDKDNNLLGTYNSNEAGLNSKNSTSICLYDKITGQALKKLKLFRLNSLSQIVDTIVLGPEGCVQLEKLSSENKISMMSDLDISTLETSSLSVNNLVLEMYSSDGTKTLSQPIGVNTKLYALNKKLITGKFIDGKTGQPVKDLLFLNKTKSEVNFGAEVMSSEFGFILIPNSKAGEFKLESKTLGLTFRSPTPNKASDKNVEIMFNGNTVRIEVNADNYFECIVDREETKIEEFELVGVVKSKLNGNDKAIKRIYLKTSDGMLISDADPNSKGEFLFKNIPPGNNYLLNINEPDLNNLDLTISGKISGENSKNLQGDLSVYLVNNDNMKVAKSVSDKDGNFSIITDKKTLQPVDLSKNNEWNKVEKGKNDTLVFNTIYFEYDKWNLLVESENQLDLAIAFLKKNPGVNLKINAHTDSRGNDEYNYFLSEKRAKSVFQYFLAHNISAERLTYIGHGEKVLANNCSNGVYCPDGDHRKNRRIEFEIIWDKSIVNKVNENNAVHNSNTVVINNASSNKGEALISNEQGVFYRVQIVTSGDLMSITSSIFKELEGVQYYKGSNIYKYTYGKTTTLEEALVLREKMLQMGFKGAFVVKFVNGQRSN